MLFLLSLSLLPSLSLNPPYCGDQPEIASAETLLPLCLGAAAGAIVKYSRSCTRSLSQSIIVFTLPAVASGDCVWRMEVCCRRADRNSEGQRNHFSRFARYPTLPPPPYLVKQVDRHSGRSKLIFLSGAAPRVHRNDIQVAAQTELRDHFTHASEIFDLHNSAYIRYICGCDLTKV